MVGITPALTLDDFFAGRETSRHIFDALLSMMRSIGPVELRITRSQVAFRRRTGFAYAWVPAMYLNKNDIPLVLTIGLKRHDFSPRWKQVVKPAPDTYIHHLELRSEGEVDLEIRQWLQEAWETAA